MDMKVPHSCRGTATCSWFHVLPPHRSQPRGHPSGTAPPVLPAGRPLPLPRGFLTPRGPGEPPASLLRGGAANPHGGGQPPSHGTPSGKLQDVCEPGAGRPLSPLDPTSPPITEMTTRPAFRCLGGGGQRLRRPASCWAPSRGACTSCRSGLSPCPGRRATRILTTVAPSPVSFPVRPWLGLEPLRVWAYMIWGPPRGVWSLPERRSSCCLCGRGMVYGAERCPVPPKVMPAQKPRRGPYVEMRVSADIVKLGGGRLRRC